MKQKFTTQEFVNSDWNKFHKSISLKSGYYEAGYIYQSGQVVSAQLYWDNEHKEWTTEAGKQVYWVQMYRLIETPTND